MAVITKEWAEKFENHTYLYEILEGIEQIQKENGYTDEEMDNDLDTALWKAYVYNNMDSYEFYELSEKTLAKVKEKGINNGIWCYRYSCALVYLRRYEEALEYSRHGVQVQPDYPWGYLQLGRLCYKFNLIDEAYNAIEKGLELVPDDYEFLTLKDDIENNRGFAYTVSHYIDEETDKTYEKRLLNIEDEELYNSFKNLNDLEKELEIMHKSDKHQKIIDIITNLPKEQLTYDISGRLARAYNNNGEYEKGLEILMQIKAEGEHTALWNFRAGYSCYYLQNYEEAEKYFTTCLKINPDEDDADVLLLYTYYELAHKCIYEAKYDEAFAYINKGSPLIKDNDDMILFESELVFLYRIQEEYEKAYNTLEKVISLGRNDSWVYSEAGLCLNGLEKYKEALENFEKAIELGQNDSWLFYLCSRCAYRINDEQKELEYLKKGLELYPDDIELNFTMGLFYNNKNEFAKALPYLSRAKDAGMEDVSINYELGHCLNRLERHEEALIYLEKAKEYNNDIYFIYAELGVCCKNLDKYDEALNYFEKAKILEDLPVFKREIAICLTETGRNDEAAAVFEDYIANYNDKDITALSYLGEIYVWQEDYEKALLYLYQAESLGRSDSWIYITIGYVLMQIDNIEKAAEYTKKALEVSEEDDDYILSRLGYLYFKLEKYDEAAIYLEKAYNMDKNNDWTAYYLGKAYRKINKLDKAADILESILEQTEYKGYVELELAVCYALLNDKEKADFYLNDAKLLVEDDSELEEAEQIIQMMNNPRYFS